MSEYLSIPQWSVEDRPREKMLIKGTASLSDAELLAILIGSGTKNESAVELAKKILTSAGNNLNELAKLSLIDLQKTKGIGEVKALTIAAALELGRRRKMADIIQRKKISGSNDIFEIFSSILGDLPYEEFWAILLNRSNTIIEKIKISKGGISGTVTDVRIILKEAIDRLASGIILCHNHPSGNTQPSEADVLITKKVREAGSLMDINLLDHIIIGNKSYYSFADEGMI